VIREVRVATEPVAIFAVLTEEPLAIERVGLEAGGAWPDVLRLPRLRSSLRETGLRGRVGRTRTQKCRRKISCEFAGIQPNSGHRDHSRLSCGVAQTQLIAKIRKCNQNLITDNQVISHSLKQALLCGLAAHGMCSTVKCEHFLTTQIALSPHSPDDLLILATGTAIQI
jgi:hypothetical protein